MGIWLGYTCATMYDFHEHKHIQFGGSNDLGLAFFLSYTSDLAGWDAVNFGLR